MRHNYFYLISANGENNFNFSAALLSMTNIWCFSSFYRRKIKLLYLFLHLLIQISPQNHNYNALDVFFTALSHIIIRDQRMVQNALPLLNSRKTTAQKFYIFCWKNVLMRMNQYRFLSRLRYRIPCMWVSIWGFTVGNFYAFQEQNLLQYQT